MARASLTVAVVTAACLSLGQTRLPVQDRITATARERISALTGQFPLILATDQARLDAAGCRRGCPGADERFADQMKNALNAVTAKIHAEVDRFVRATAETNNRGFPANRVADGLQRILPVGESTAVFQGRSRSAQDYLIATYVIHKGGVMGDGATSVMLRAYNRTARAGVVLTDVIGDDMDGYGQVTVREVRPYVPASTAPIQETFLLLSGYMTGANGPNNRMRLYAYDGRRFRPIWMPANVWGSFDVRVIDGGFTVVGAYYRESQKRNDRYTLLRDGLIQQRSN